MMLYLFWALWLAAAELVLTAFQLKLKNKKFRPAARAGIIAAKLLSAVAFAALTMAGPVQLRPVQQLMTALYAVLLPDAAADLIYSIITAAAKKERRFAAVKITGLVLTVLFAVAGTVNMQTVSGDTHTYYSEKIKQDRTFVFVADLHAGNAQNFSTAEKTVNEIKSLNPDFIVLGGDITDDYTTKEQMETLYAMFSDFENPVYYIYGNHDRQPHAEYANGRQYTAEELKDTLEKNGITVLKDEFAEISDDIILLGKEDDSTADKCNPYLLSAPEKYKDAYFIVAAHQPGSIEAFAEIGADLQVSGHTHAGQFFPLKWIYDLFISDACGEYKHGDTILYVTPGAGGWRFPFRTAGSCKYEIFNLKASE